ncbi:HEAT repeat domain-containing protein [Catenuloplanes japonicus]|uniref:HEAT repeat domain-containing protein n=1 Tax=Catenuloplanes japonicus TaxID=33876 RepID=UPI0005255887|nr:HEAT repeat domain-containing protein [Catenuloplanes japonicus]
MNEKWSAWSLEIFGEPFDVWHDGASFAELEPRARTAPDEVAAMLALGLREQDPVAAQSYRHLSTVDLAPPGAAGLLRSAAERADGRFLIRLAEALFTLTGDPSWASSLISVLQGDDSEYVRLDAAIALRDFPPVPPTVAAVTAAIGDPAFLVRNHAADTLAHYSGTTVGSALFTTIAAPAEGEPTDEDRRGWQRVADELAARLG